MTSQTINVNELFKTAQAEGTVSKALVQSLNLNDIGGAINAAMGLTANDVTVADVILLTILIDDSGSIRFQQGNAQAIRDGYNTIIESLMNSKQKDNILVHVKYLNGTQLFAYKPLDQCEKMTPQNYDPMGGTPPLR